MRLRIELVLEKGDLLKLPVQYDQLVWGMIYATSDLAEFLDRGFFQPVSLPEIRDFEAPRLLRLHRVGLAISGVI